MTNAEADGDPVALPIEHRAGIVLAGLILLLAVGLLTAPPAKVVDDRSGPSGSRYPADIRAARADLEQALLTAQTFALGNGDSFTGFDAAAAAIISPSLVWHDAVPATVGAISIDYADGPTVILSTRATSGTYLCRAISKHDDAAGFEDALGATLSAGCAGANP